VDRLTAAVPEWLLAAARTRHTPVPWGQMLRAATDGLLGTVVDTGAPTLPGCCGWRHPPCSAVRLASRLARCCTAVAKPPAGSSGDSLLKRSRLRRRAYQALSDLRAELRSR